VGGRLRRVEWLLLCGDLSIVGGVLSVGRRQQVVRGVTQMRILSGLYRMQFCIGRFLSLFRHEPAAVAVVTAATHTHTIAASDLCLRHDGFAGGSSIPLKGHGCQYEDNIRVRIERCFLEPTRVRGNKSGRKQIFFSIEWRDVQDERERRRFHRGMLG
jgi:hypothetical protein